MAAQRNGLDLVNYGLTSNGYFSIINLAIYEQEHTHRDIQSMARE